MGGAMLGLATALMMLFSGDAMRAATQAAALFARGVMPALFPMLVLGSVFTMRKTEHFMATVAFAFAAGTPASAQRVRRLYDAGGANGAGLAALLAATGVMSPLFFVGTLAAWTGDARAAWAMLLSHWAGALITAGIVRAGGGRGRSEARRARACAGAARGRGTSGKQSCAGKAQGTGEAYCTRQEAGKQSCAEKVQEAGEAKRNAAQPPPVPLSRALPDALKSSAQALLSVCAAMMLFSVAASVLRALLARVSPELAAAKAPLLAVVHAALEIGGGCAAMVKQGLPAPLVCAMCGFGGLSLWLQSLMFVGEIISPAKLLAVRALHGAISYVVCAGAMALMAG